MRRVDTQQDMEEQLDSFDADERSAALDRLAALPGDVVRAPGTNVNMHFHSFFSYNAEGWSPSHIAWEAKKSGLYAAGLCDFDVVDGLEEFLAAGRKLGLRTTVNLETRAFVKEYSDVEINSPGEPGVSYTMGAGFVRIPAEGTSQAEGLAGYRERALRRNTALIERINRQIDEIAVDYERDVLPLTPRGVATERHIISAYVNKAMAVFEHPQPAANFWSKLLGFHVVETLELMADRPSFEGTVRNKLAKSGGLGYEQPSVDTFPPVDEFLEWVASCDAIPMAGWLDGTLPGEADGRGMLELMQSKGAAVLNIIPDRNWNLSDPDERSTKVANLNHIVAVAEDMHLPLNTGTEMNKLGLPFSDDLDCEALRPHKDAFIRGARVVVGHTVLLRYAGMSYIGEQAQAEFPNVSARNDFFEAVGALPALTMDRAKDLEDMGPRRALEALQAAIRK